MEVAAPAGRASVISPPGGAAPSSSKPVMETVAGAAAGLTSRSRLTWLSLLAGLKKTTSRRPSDFGTTVFMLVRNPLAVRT